MEPDLFAAFQDYESEQSPKPRKKTPQECAAISHQIFKCIARTHKAIDVSSWPIDILNTLNVPLGSYLVRVTKVDIRNICTVFIFAEETEILTSRCIQELVHKNIFISNLDKEDHRVVMLSEVIDHALTAAPTQLACVMYSGTLKSLWGETEHSLLVQYTPESTVRTSAVTLIDALSSQYSVMPVDTAELFSSDPTPQHSISESHSSQDITRSIELLSRRLDRICRRVTLA